MTHPRDELAERRARRREHRHLRPIIGGREVSPAIAEHLANERLAQLVADARAEPTGHDEQAIDQVAGAAADIGRGVAQLKAAIAHAEKCPELQSWVVQLQGFVETLPLVQDALARSARAMVDSLTLEPEPAA